MYLRGNKFHLYYIESDYINYLRKYDKRVYVNKNPKRPYLGTVCIFQNKKYFIPMTSPKPKHLKMNPNLVDIYIIKNGKLGLLNINNMIPVNNESIKKVNIKEEDNNYGDLLNRQIIEINKNKREILTKIGKFCVLYKTNKLYENIRARTCDFELLEEKCYEWKNKNRLKEDEEIYSFDANDYRVWAY